MAATAFQDRGPHDAPHQGACFAGGPARQGQVGGDASRKLSDDIHVNLHKATKPTNCLLGSADSCKSPMVAMQNPLPFDMPSGDTK